MKPHRFFYFNLKNRNGRDEVLNERHQGIEMGQSVTLNTFNTYQFKIWSPLGKCYLHVVIKAGHN